MREFTTSVKNANDEESLIGGPVTFKIDDREVVFLPATSAQMAMLIMNFELGTGSSMTAASINCFFDWMESDDDRRHFSRRLFSRKDEFDEEKVYEILFALVEEWSGNPTEPSPTSSSSPPTGGEPSTDGASADESTHST